MAPKRKPALKKRSACVESSSDTASTSTTVSSSSSCSRKEEANVILLPSQSAATYKKEYKAFIDSVKIKDSVKPSENNIMAYMQQQEKDGKAAATQWSRFSMIKAVIGELFGPGDSYPLVTAYLKRRDEADGLQKKAKVFTAEEVFRFIEMDHSSMAESHKILLYQAFIIFAYYGGLRCAENYGIEKKGISEDKLGIWVCYTAAKQRGKKKRKPATFLIPKGNMTQIVNKYLQSVPQGCDFLWHAVQYTASKTTSGFKASRVGINTLRNITVKVATILGLNNPLEYTGHAMRRSSATQMANSGASLADLMQFFNWTSTTVAQEYLERSKRMLSKLASTLAPEKAEQEKPPTTNQDHLLTELETSQPGLPILPRGPPSTQPVVVYNFSNITGNITIGASEQPKPRPKAQK